MVTVILKVVEMTLLKYPTWGDPARKQCICWQWSWM